MEIKSVKGSSIIIPGITQKDGSNVAGYYNITKNKEQFIIKSGTKEIPIAERVLEGNNKNYTLLDSQYNNIFKDSVDAKRKLSSYLSSENGNKQHDLTIGNGVNITDGQTISYKGGQTTLISSIDPLVQNLVANAAITSQARESILKGNPVNRLNIDPPPDGQPTVEAINALQIAYLKDYEPRKNFGNLRYPKTLHEHQDVIKFDIVQYLPRNLSTKNKVTFDPRYDYKSPRLENSLGSIILPIQPNISDTNGVNWSEDTMNAFELLAAGVSASFMSTGAEEEGRKTSIINEIQKTIDEAQGPNNKLTDSAKAALTTLLGGRAANPASNPTALLSRLKGAIINPNMELLFSSPNLRAFGFNFKFVPRTQDESEEVVKIIRAFKEASAVQRGILDFFLKAPNVFKIAYLTSKKNQNGSYELVPHPGINKMKFCALTGISVDYVPDGTYMTRTDGGMTAYEMSLQFAELEPIYADDYLNMEGETNYAGDPYIGY